MRLSWWKIDEIEAKSNKLVGPFMERLSIWLVISAWSFDDRLAFCFKLDFSIP